MKKTGSAVNRAIKQTKAAMSILLPQCFEDRALLTDDTRASGQKFNRVHRIPSLVGCGGGVRMAASHEVGHILNHRKVLAGDNRRNAVGMAVQSGQIFKDTLTREVHPEALQGDKAYAPEMMAVAFQPFTTVGK
jgi:hypothetical protein